MAGVKTRYWQRVVKAGSELKIYASETGLDWVEIGTVPLPNEDFDIKWVVEVEEPETEEFSFALDENGITDIKLGDNHEDDD